jgi:hypothetical protein
MHPAACDGSLGMRGERGAGQHPTVRGCAGRARGEIRGCADALMGSFSSLLSVRSRAHIDANLRRTPPSFHEMQVSRGVGDGDEQADAAASRADGESQVACFAGVVVLRAASR